MAKLPDNLREFDDTDATRSLIYDNALDSLKKRFPVEDDEYRLDLSNPHYTGPKEFSLDQQKNALMKDRHLHVPVTGTWRLYHKPTQTVLDEREDVVMHVPYYTPRGTFIFNGNEYSVVNQSRLKPGAYTRQRRTGDVETQFNVRPGTGRSFHLRLEPETGIFRVNVEQSNVPMYSLLHTLGVSDQDLMKAWGPEILENNIKKQDPRAIPKLYERFSGYKFDKNAKEDDMRKYLVDSLSKFELDPDVVGRTLGLPNVATITPQALVRATQKMLNISKGTEKADDRDAPLFSNVYGVEDLIAERIDKDAGKVAKGLLYKLRRDKTLAPVRRGALDPYIMGPSGFLLASRLTMPLEETNPLHTLEQTARITKLGQGGISSAESITDEARNVNNGQFGFIDPITGPEGCFSPDMEVMTQTGWITWDEVKDDTVFACLVEDRLIYSKASEIHRGLYDGMMYGVQTKHFGYLVTEQHKLWLRAYDEGSEYRFEHSASAFSKSRFVKCGGHLPYEANEISTAFELPIIDGDNHLINETEPIPMDLWASFMGWFISEGSVMLRSDNNYVVSISQHDPENIEVIREILDQLPFKYQKCIDSEGQFHSFTIVQKQLGSYLNQFGKSHEKFIPEYFFETSSSSRRLLLDALCAGDGRKKGSTFGYCTTSRRLALDVERLAFSLGYSVRVRFEKDEREQAKQGGCWCVSLHLSTERCVYYSKEHHFREQYEGMTYCATVPGNLLYVRRGKFGGHWSGNMNIGIDVRASYRSFKGKDKQIYGEFRHPQSGKLFYLRPEDVADKAVAFPGEMQRPGELVTVMQHGEIHRVPKHEVQLEVPSFGHMMSSHTNLNPMPTGVQPGRQFYGAKFWSQYLPMVNGETPLVDSLTPEGDKTFSEHYGRRIGTMQSKVGGIVTKIGDNSITVVDDNGEKHITELVKDFPFNRLTGVSYFPAVKTGDKVNVGDMLAHSNFTDSKTGAINMGRNLKTVIIPARGQSFEDAYVISESAAKKMTTERLFGFDQESRHGVEIDKNKFISTFMDKFTKNQIENIGADGIVKSGTRVEKGDPLILATGPKLLTSADAQLGKLHKVLRNAFTDKSVVWENSWPGTVTDVAMTPHGARVNVKSTPPVQTGDKLCYDSETEVLTRTGWKKFCQLTLDDCVATLNPDTNEFEYLPPILVMRYSHSGRMYKLSTQQLDLLVTDNHRLFVQPRNSDSFGFVTPNEAFGKRVSYKKDGIWRGAEIANVTIPGGFKGRYRGPIPLDDLLLPIDTYLTLLGMFLSEGNCFDNSHAGSYGIEFTQMKGPSSDKMIKSLIALGFKNTYQVAYGKFRIYDIRLLNHFKQFGHAHDKFIPDWIFNLSTGKLRILFNWLMWGDGHFESGKPICYTTVSPRLADDVQRLCLHIGFAANVKLGRIKAGRQTKIGERVITANYDVHDVRIVTTKLTPTVNHSHVKQQHTQTEIWQDYAGDVWCCAMSKWHVIYVRRNGKAVWCGNSTRFGLKGVVGKLVPDDQMPRDLDTNEPYDLMLNPMGILSRVAPNQLFEMQLAKIAKKTGKQVRLPQLPPEEGWAAWAQKQLKDNGIKEDTDIFDPETGKTIKGVANGHVFVSAFHHLAEKKLSSRGEQGAYTIDEQPAKGSAGHAKKYSMMDVNATLAHGATEVIRDAALIRGTRNEEYFKALKLGRPLPEPTVPFIYDKFLNTLRAGGVNVSEKGDVLSLMPMTDKDINSLSKGAINTKRPFDMISSDFEPTPSGLFDMGKTGGMDGNRWTHIELNEPMPNPVMEEPIRRILGMKVRELHDVISGAATVNGISGGRGLKDALAGLDIDAELEKNKQLVKTTRGAVRDNAVKVLGYLSAAKKQGIHPADWIITKVPVLPPKFRPVSRLGEIALVTDMNELYAALMEVNNNLHDMRKEVPDSTLAEQKGTLYDAVTAAYGLGEPITPEGRSKRLKGAIRQVIGSSPKTGLFQSRVISKTVGGVGRGVVTPDPNLDMDSIGIPEDSAWNIYKDFVMRRLVRKGYPTIQAMRLLEERHPIAREMLDAEMQARPVIVDRAPTWHKFNLLAMYPHVVEGNTIRVSPLVTKGFNMDFDGDQANFHVPISDKAAEQAKEKMLPSKNLFSLTDLKSIRHSPSMEMTLGLYHMTQPPSNKPPVRFATVQEAQKAYRESKIKLNDPIIIGAG